VNIHRATAGYEEWLSGELQIVLEDLELKHKQMRDSLLRFFRGTFYRFAQIWPEVCPECADAPKVLAVGDLHVENFGTWRDVEGRLVWGINDFDEVARMPWTIDLVRLAASAHLAIEAEQLQIARGEACAAILAGYREGFEAGGRPWVLGGSHLWLHHMVSPSLRDPVAFWEKMKSWQTYKGRTPGGARRGLEKMMPGEHSECRIAHRVAGMGSLGRQRFIAITEYAGGLVCREAKALATSAWSWAQGGKQQPIRYQKVLDTAVRDRDPFVRLEGSWIIRRLAPDCSKIDLGMFPKEKDETRLLHAMGFETANVHLGSGGREVMADFDQRPKNWVHKAAAKMVDATLKDWSDWRAGAGGK
jgi:hypothetical protein